VTGVGLGRHCGGGATADRGGGSDWELGNGVPVAEMENGRHYELQEGDVVLVEQEVGEGRLGIELPTARPNGAAMADGGDVREKGAGAELSSGRW
jgi:hypothetical protein